MVDIEIKTRTENYHVVYHRGFIIPVIIIKGDKKSKITVECNYTDEVEPNGMSASYFQNYTIYCGEKKYEAAIDNVLETLSDVIVDSIDIESEEIDQICDAVEKVIKEKVETLDLLDMD
jgi:hypothetical protein